MKITVIISTYSKEKISYVKRCLESIRQQNLEPLETLLILDEDQDLINFYSKEIPDLKIHSSGGKGLSKARNYGVMKAKGEIVAFIDDDAVADKNWIMKATENLQQGGLAGIGGKITPSWEEGRPMWFPEELDWIIGCTYKGLPEEKHSIRNPIGCNMAFRTVLVKEAGLFKEELGRIGKVLLGSEETDLSMRILEKHPELNIYYDPHMVVFHQVPASRASLRYVLRRAFYEGVSKAFLAKLHPNKNKSLSTENNYFKYLIYNSIPQRLVKLYSLASLSQLFSIVLVILAVGTGYLYGKIRFY